VSVGAEFLLFVVGFASGALIGMHLGVSYVLHVIKRAETRGEL